MSIVKLKTFDVNFNGSPPFWADGTEVHEITLMCVDAIESKYQLLSKWKLSFDLVVHHQQHSHCFYIVYGNVPVCLAKFEKNFTKCDFYFVTQFMSKCNFYLEMEGIQLKCR